jgi:nicotinate-nucleotide pyrophosphorylase (carboxylating)
MKLAELRQIIAMALREDLGDGDHSSIATIPEGTPGRARLLVKEEGILAGVDVARQVFSQLDGRVLFTRLLEDGAHVGPGDVAFLLEGPAVSLLSGERLALNFMQRMSGIATFTRQVVDRIEGTRARILDTRKTTPNMRLLEKEAVRIGGGYNHRFGLFDMIMIKDNHIDYAGGIAAAINRTHEYLASKKPGLRIEVEVRNFAELEEVLACGGVDRIMLDNFTPSQLAEAVEMIGGRAETEASGGISLHNIREFALTGVDFISVGALTHHIKSLDMSLKAVKM